MDVLLEVEGMMGLALMVILAKGMGEVEMMWGLGSGGAGWF